jgi:hypothetical protein
VIYHIAYGKKHVQTSTLYLARIEAKRIARETIYPIEIVHNGDVVETWTPTISKTGRVTFKKTKGQ